MSKPRYHLIDTIRAQADVVKQKENQNKLLMDSQKHDLRVDYSVLFHLQTYYHFLMGQQHTAESLINTPPDVLEGKAAVNGQRMEVDFRKHRKNPSMNGIVNPEEGD